MRAFKQCVADLNVCFVQAFFVLVMTLPVALMHKPWVSSASSKSADNSLTIAWYRRTCVITAGGGLAFCILCYTFAVIYRRCAFLQRCLDTVLHHTCTMLMPRHRITCTIGIVCVGVLPFCALLLQSDARRSFDTFCVLFLTLAVLLIREQFHIISVHASASRTASVKARQRMRTTLLDGRFPVFFAGLEYNECVVIFCMVGVHTELLVHYGSGYLVDVVGLLQASARQMQLPSLGLLQLSMLSFADSEIPAGHHAARMLLGAAMMGVIFFCICFVTSSIGAFFASAVTNAMALVGTPVLHIILTVWASMYVMIVGVCMALHQWMAELSFQLGLLSLCSLGLGMGMLLDLINTVRTAAWKAFCTSIKVRNVVTSQQFLFTFPLT